MTEVTYDVTAPTLRGLLYLMAPQETCEFLSTYGYINTATGSSLATAGYPSLVGDTSGSSLLTLLGTEIATYHSENLDVNTLRGEGILGLCLILRTEPAWMNSQPDSAAQPVYSCLLVPNLSFLSSYGLGTQISDGERLMAVLQTHFLNRSSDFFGLTPPEGWGTLQERWDAAVAFDTDHSDNNRNYFCVSERANSNAETLAYADDISEKIVHMPKIYPMREHVVQAGYGIADMAAEAADLLPAVEDIYPTLIAVPEDRRGLYGTLGFGGVRIACRSFTWNATPTGGSFTLTVYDPYNGRTVSNSNPQTTASIPYNATAQQIVDAVEALSNVTHVWIGDITVSSGVIRSFTLMFYNDDEENWRYERAEQLRRIDVNISSLTGVASVATLADANAYRYVYQDQRESDWSFTREPGGNGVSAVLVGQNLHLPNYEHLKEYHTRQIGDWVNRLHDYAVSQDAEFDEKIVTIISSTQEEEQWRYLSDAAAMANQTDNFHTVLLASKLWQDNEQGIQDVCGRYLQYQFSQNPTTNFTQSSTQQLAIESVLGFYSRASRYVTTFSAWQVYVGMNLLGSNFDELIHTSTSPIAPNVFFKKANLFTLNGPSGSLSQPRNYGYNIDFIANAFSDNRTVPLSSTRRCTYPRSELKIRSLSRTAQGKVTVDIFRQAESALSGIAYASGNDLGAIGYQTGDMIRIIPSGSYGASFASSTVSKVVEVANGGAEYTFTLPDLPIYPGSEVGAASTRLSLTVGGKTASDTGAGIFEGDVAEPGSINWYTGEVHVIFDGNVSGNITASYVNMFVVESVEYNVPATITGSISGATNASPIQITSAAHGLFSGMTVVISGVGGNTAANGSWRITKVDADNFRLVGSTGNGSYTSGGSWSYTNFVDRIIYQEPYSPTRGAASQNLLSRATSTTAAYLYLESPQEFQAFSGGITYSRGTLVPDAGSTNLSTITNLSWAWLWKDSPGWLAEIVFHTFLQGEFLQLWVQGDEDHFLSSKTIYDAISEVASLTENQGMAPIPQISEYIHRWGTRYILSGMAGGGKRILRLTFQPAGEARDLSDPVVPHVVSYSPAAVMTCDGNTLVFPQGSVLTEDSASPFGVWIRQTGDVSFSVQLPALPGTRGLKYPRNSPSLVPITVSGLTAPNSIWRQQK